MNTTNTILILLTQLQLSVITLRLANIATAIRETKR